MRLELKLEGARVESGNDDAGEGQENEINEPPA
jgi:hypothetical protein